MCRKKPTKRRRKLRRYIAVFVLFCAALSVYYELAVKALLGDIIIREMKTVSERAMNSAVADFLDEHFDVGEKLSEISYSEGRVAAVSSNPSYVNFVKTQITQKAQEYIDELSQSEGVGVRLGNFTGLVCLSDIGPEVRFRVESACTVSCEFDSSFESAGLNQTVHRVVMNVCVDLNVYNPFRISRTISTQSDYEIARTVIVGSVPSYGGVVSNW